MIVLLVVQKINNPGLFAGFSTVVKIKAVLCWKKLLYHCSLTGLSS